MKSQPGKLHKGLQAWLDWLMFYEQDNLVEATIKEMRSMGETLDEIPTRRMEFHQFKTLLLKSRRASMDDYFILLKEFDKLENLWGESSITIGVEPYNWFSMRRAIFRRMAIEILKTCLSIDDINIYVSANPDRLIIPSTFDYSAYKIAIQTLYKDFKDFSLATPSYSDKTIIAEELQMDMLRFTRDLLVDSSPTSNKIQLSAAKIVGVIRENNVSHFINDITEFFDGVMKLLPVPVYVFEYLTRDIYDGLEDCPVVDCDIMTRAVDWTEEKKSGEGPYKIATSSVLSPAAIPLHTAAASEPHSSQQSDANIASAYLVAASPHLESANKKKDAAPKKGRKAARVQGSDGAEKEHSEAVSGGKSTPDVHRRRSVQERKQSSHPSETTGGSIADECDEVNTQPQSIELDLSNSQRGARKRRRASRASTGTVARKVTTIDEDDRQEALGREPGNAAEGVEEVDDDSDDGRKKAIDKVLDLNQKSLAPAPALTVGGSPRRVSVDGAVKKRRKWSPDEEIALIEALEKYFKGQWSQMKSDPQFSDRLKSRTSVNLKDKYRDLLKHGRLPNIVETDDEEK